MRVLGISAHFHESAACLLDDGRLVAAAEEERFSRVKHDAALPVSAVRFCLDAGGIDVHELDCIAYYERPEAKLARQLWSGRVPSRSIGLDPMRPLREVKEALGYEGRVETFDHHLSHAGGSFLYSGFEEAAILTVDGVGEWTSTAYGRGNGASIELFETVEFPHSLGLLYSTITSYLGFRVNGGEYKVMGLAPYGKPRFLPEFRKMVRSREAGGYELSLEYFDFVKGRRMFSERLPELFGEPPRAPESELSPFHQDVARSLQAALEEILLEKVSYLKQKAPSENLCLGGGVALNCVANGRILREGPFARLFVQPAAGDSGSCLGAAALAHARLTGRRHSSAPLEHVYLGPRFTSSSVGVMLAAAGVRATDYRDREAELIEATVDRLCEGKIVGWFQGAMELGPRALGARSLLADPRRPEMRERLNALVKKREAFRPFAPSILLSETSRHLDLDHPSPFMLETCRVESPLALPAVTHVDGSARPQTVDPRHAPRYARLLEAFQKRTGCPLLVNTSFNVRDEPIVCTPEDALSCAVRSGIDALAIEDHLVDRSGFPPELTELVRHRDRTASRQRSIDAALYTFV
jgi:carbamoyltransferase